MAWLQVSDRGGAQAIEQFVKNGGTFIGSCAGAYLVMDGIDLPPYTPFKLIKADMGNYSVSPPPPLSMPHKYRVPYGEGYVFHSAYGPVRVAMSEKNIFRGLGNIVAPLYGGPVIIPGEGTDITARYLAPEKGCIPLAGDKFMKNTLIEGCAGACAGKGEGYVYIFGPHFECPSFPGGYSVMERVLSYAGLNVNSYMKKEYVHAARKKGSRYLREIKGELSNARIVAFGLERMPVSWTIGTKVWEPEKIRYFIEFAWKRLGGLESVSGRVNTDKNLEMLAKGAALTTIMIRRLKKEVDYGMDTTGPVTELFTHLKRQTVLLLETLLPYSNGMPGMLKRKTGKRGVN